MPYFRNNQGDLVDDAGVVVTNPATRLEISQSIGGELNNLPIWTPPATLAPTNPLDNRTLPESLSLETLAADVNAPPAASPYSTPALIEEERKRAEAQRRIVSGQFDTLDEEARLRGEAEKGGAKLGTGRLRGEGFSSAAEAYLQNVQTQSEKRMERLRNDRQTALASLDMESARNISALMQKENERQDKLSEIKFNRLTTLLGLGLQVKQLEFNQDQALKLDNQKAQQFILDNGITKPYYQLGGIAYDSKTQQPVDPAKLDPSQIHKIEPGTKAAKDYAMAMAEKYGDAGIQPTDDAVAIAAKIKKSAIYRKETYIAPTNDTKDLKAERDYLKSTIAGGIVNMSKQINPVTGQKWTQAEQEDFIASQGFDPGEFQDTINRTYMTPDKYNEWRKSEIGLKKGAGGGSVTSYDANGNPTTITW